jgi:hypothetical protein
MCWMEKPRSGVAKTRMSLGIPMVMLLNNASNGSFMNAGILAFFRKRLQAP